MLGIRLGVLAVFLSGPRCCVERPMRAKRAGMPLAVQVVLILAVFGMVQDRVIPRNPFVAEGLIPRFRVGKVGGGRLRGRRLRPISAFAFLLCSGKLVVDR